MKKRIAEAWASYERAVLPPQCGAAQRRDTRNAFYAGAFSLMEALSSAMSPDDEDVVTEADVQVLHELAAEQEEFLAEIEPGG